ncbi:hypothetical protein JCGZ_02771 [Jatropha curcas]|uniref:Uncharacterized protein n=1 Tax=Jatropha curcas TaxID=180498 RepID=A0A067KU85_JATCU|nr:hypothetical protein JCGZ_02771 [Jatropha curcas]
MTGSIKGRWKENFFIVRSLKDFGIWLVEILLKSLRKRRKSKAFAQEKKKEAGLVLRDEDKENAKTSLAPTREVEVIHLSVEDDIPLARKKKRSRIETSEEAAWPKPAWPDVEGYIKAIHGVSISYSQSPLVHQVVIMRKRVRDLRSHYAKLEVSKNEVIHLVETAKEMLDKSATTHSKEMCALKELVNLLNNEYKKVADEALITSSRNIQLEKEKTEEANDALNNIMDTLDGFQDRVISALKAQYTDEDFDFISEIPVIVPHEDPQDLPFEQVNEDQVNGEW